MKIKEKGITMISLVVTIVVLLILAGVGVATLTGDNSLIKQAGNAKEQTEIAAEKEDISVAAVNAMGKDRNGELSISNLQEALNNRIGEGKTEVSTYADDYVVYFKESNRIYQVDSEGNASQCDEVIARKDNTPGVLEGKGTEDEPYIIMSIEDLVSFSQQNANKTNNFVGKIVELGKPLDFNSQLSYCNYQTKEYNEFLGVSDDVGLLEALTNRKYSGFAPIKDFQGDFNGNNFNIINIYENSTTNAGFFVGLYGNVKNLTIKGNISGNGYVGGITASLARTKTIENCVFDGTLSNSTEEATYQGTGAIVGRSTTSAIIKRCISKGYYTSTKEVAGIVGYGTDNLTIDMCYNEAKLAGNNSTGGIISKGNGCIIKNCFNIGEVISSGGYAGGISAYKCKEISNCFNTGTIKGKTAGGLVGQYYFEDAKINNSYNYGIVKDLNDANASAVTGGVYVVSTTLTLNNVFYQGDLTNKWCGGGQNYITGEPEALTKVEMISTTGLLKKLNDYVKLSTDIDLVEWRSGENGYPELAIDY